MIWETSFNYLLTSSQIEKVRKSEMSLTEFETAIVGKLPTLVIIVSVTQ